MFQNLNLNFTLYSDIKQINTKLWNTPYGLWNKFTAGNLSIQIQETMVHHISKNFEL